MYKKTSGTRRWKAGAALFSALMLVLSLTLLTVSLLTGCTKDPKPDDTQTQSAPATSELTTAPPETTLPTETAGTEDSTDVPASETEPTAEPLPADWVPTLNKTDISFFGPGESYILVVPGAAGHFDVVWSAENEEIASVDETGRVTAVGPGSARIFAKVADTTLECWIRCKFDTPPAEGEPTLNSTDISFFGVGESYRLKVSNAPEDAMIVWTSEDYGVAYVDDNGRVRAVGPGTIRVSARVGDKVLSCWVRCKFAAPEIPRSSVADGSWLVTLRKSGVTALNEEAGVYVATADLLSRIQITLDELESLEPYSKLDLSRFGLGSFRVSAVNFNAEKNICTVTAGDETLRFSRDDNELWTLLDENGEGRLYSTGTGRFVFTDDTRVYEQTGADESALVPRADVLDLFDKQPGYENELPRVGLTVSDGLVTRVVWYYEP